MWLSFFQVIESALVVFGVSGEKVCVGYIRNVDGILMNKIYGLGGGGRTDLYSTAVSLLHRFLCHKWSYERVSICMLCLKYRECILVCGGCSCWHHVSVVLLPYIKPCTQYVVLVPCSVVLSLLQTLMHFSSFGFLTYILFCIIILRFPQFYRLSADSCLLIWYVLFVCSHVLFKVFLSVFVSIHFRSQWM
jgi:hypothetical protein